MIDKATSIKGGPPRIFDRRIYALRRARARGTTFLVQEAAAHLAGRIATFGREFKQGLDLSSRDESFAELRTSAEHWTRTALTSRARARGTEKNVTADEEALPFRAKSFDIITSVLSLHAVNDLPGALIQIRRVLQPGGVFLAALFGGETLMELRHAFAAGESESTGGVSPRVAPFADVRDLGELLQRAEFVDSVADRERTLVRYRDFKTLASDLRALGETSALAQRSRTFLRRDVLRAVLRHLNAHREPGERTRATFEIIYLTAMAP